MMIQNTSSPPPSTTHSNSDPILLFPNNENSKRKRRPAGTPDPDAEVVSLSPKTLLESDRYVCEICNQGFQRDQNLQMHRRRHKVPWKLLKRENPVGRKRVFVCPEPSCLHHDPCHALGDLVGIKKHFRRKHSNHKQWVCEKCSKGYAVQSDYKAHLKTCGTRGHSCDCGRVFSRVESFIEHQDACNMGRLLSESHTVQAACLSRTTSSPSPSSDDNIPTKAAPWTSFTLPKPTLDHMALISQNDIDHNLDLQLSTRSSISPQDHIHEFSPLKHENHPTHLQLSIGSSDINEKNGYNQNPAKFCRSGDGNRKAVFVESKLKEEAREELRLAMEEKAFAEDARRHAKRQIELAELEFANAKRVRRQAQTELEKALALRAHATKQFNSTLLQITCHACKQRFRAQKGTFVPLDENALMLSYMSSALTENEFNRGN